MIRVFSESFALFSQEDLGGARRSTLPRPSVQLSPSAAIATLHPPRVPGGILNHDGNHVRTVVPAHYYSCDPHSLPLTPELQAFLAHTLELTHLLHFTLSITTLNSRTSPSCDYEIHYYVGCSPSGAATSLLYS